MRIKDENKKTAITKAVIGLINEIGFANISMSKIAKATGISAATLYVYYENKEDMFRKVYLDVKKEMTAECSKNVCGQESVQDAVRKLCENLLRYMKEHTEEFLFLEQACNSPLATDEMIEARKKANRITDMRTKAIAYHDTVAPYLDIIRSHIDELELMVDNQMWPLPKYRELLFIR